MAKDSIFVDEPPKLLVEIKERHYVTCNGDNDGELVAHAVGGRPDHIRQLPYDYQWYKVDIDSILLETFQKNDSILTELYSARYVVCVTDTNGIQAFSEIFHLTQPDSLLATTRMLQSVQCAGGNTGQLEAVVTGGTPPYSCFWETGDTTHIISGLAKGIYSLYIRDARYLDSKTHFCSSETFGKIESPNGMNVAATIVNPTCYSYSNGKISVAISGGVAPYTCLWLDGITGKDRANLPDGDYYLTVTDANGCSLMEKYTLHQPAALTVNIGGEFTLCKNRSTSLNGSIGLENINYRWTKDGTETSTDSLCTIASAGHYELTVTDADGCSASDEITVQQSEDELVADFVVASKIPNSTKVYAINIIRTGYDRIEWILPDEATVWEQSADSIQFSFFRNGSYPIGIIADKGMCRDILYKTIEVVNKKDIEDYNDSEPFLKQFTAYPNPNGGNFRVLVALREASEYQLYLYNSNGNLIETKKEINSMGGEIPFDKPELLAGVYYLRFVSRETTSILKIVIN
jgi:hypothetical protein